VFSHLDIFWGEMGDVLCFVKGFIGWMSLAAEAWGAKLGVGRDATGSSYCNRIIRFG
jgi:hypothetical protein